MRSQYMPAVSKAMSESYKAGIRDYYSGIENEIVTDEKGHKLVFYFGGQQYSKIGQAMDAKRLAHANLQSSKSTE